MIATYDEWCQYVLTLLLVVIVGLPLGPMIGRGGL